MQENLEELGTIAALIDRPTTRRGKRATTVAT
jgi:hypothetical protein